MSIERAKLFAHSSDDFFIKSSFAFGKEYFIKKFSRVKSRALNVGAIANLVPKFERLKFSQKVRSLCVRNSYKILIKKFYNYYAIWQKRQIVALVGSLIPKVNQGNYL